MQEGIEGLMGAWHRLGNGSIISTEGQLEVSRQGLYVHRSPDRFPQQLLNVVYLPARPVLYLPLEVMDSPQESPRPQEADTLPVLVAVSVLNSAELAGGVAKEVDHFCDDDSHTPPWVDKGGKLAASFLGLFANDGIIHDTLVRITKRYPYRPNENDGFDLISHLLSWDYWESNQDSVPPDAISGVKVHPMPHEYCEGIYHLCAGERLGSMWPRLIHALIITYITYLYAPEGPSFEPCIVPNLYIALEGKLDGYHPIHRLRWIRPTDDKILINPDQTKRDTLSKLGRGPERKFVEENWDELKEKLDGGLGYTRRRGFSGEVDVSHVRWLFRRHILRESIVDIADKSVVDPSTVESKIKDLRLLLDLQPKTAINCLDHRGIPGRLHEDC